ncbi:MAG: hypothetical protein BZ135_04080 [Methanosphaera sp. rholeuAM6]|nr:MAG: hypothetical protein BZ135_04080 [Methanosphaera sp. rholeuAM6]
MKLKISTEAEKFIQKSKNPLKNRLIENILFIKKNPNHNKYKYIKTKRPLKRSRCGDYRIIFYVDKKEDTLIIVDVNHRKKIYK